MIKNLIFDVGNVLIEYRWHQMLLDYGLTKEEAAIAGPLFFEHETWKELDLGNMPVEDVICLYEQRLPQYAELIRWFLTHLELMPISRPDVWEKVHALKQKGYKIYLLSNYNEDFFRVHTQDADFLKDIDGKVVSYEIHKIRGLGHSFVGSVHLLMALCAAKDESGLLLRSAAVTEKFVHDAAAVLCGVGTAELPLPQGFSREAVTSWTSWSTTCSYSAETDL